jgi:UDP-MurNAc hydroxylase
LKSLPLAFKQKVTVLFQKNNSDKIPNALKTLGFENIRLLDHRKIVSITPQTQVYNCQIGQMDSALAVLNQKQVILNVNDCELNTADCKLLLRDLKRIDVVLNQFSIAGYTGDIHYETHLPKLRERILNSLLLNHQDLKAEVTVPIASFIRFCTVDNQYINEYINTPEDVFNLFQEKGYQCSVLFPGDTLDSERPFDSNPALEKYRRVYRENDQLPYDEPRLMNLDEIQNAFLKRAKQLQEKYPAFILKKLAPVTIYIPDLNVTVQLSLYQQRFEVLPDDAAVDVKIFSQPLHYAFDTKWGFQTLGVSGRYLIQGNKSTWKWYRAITSLNNADIYLKLRFLFTKNNLHFLRTRLKGGLNQLIYQLKRMD